MDCTSLSLLVVTVCEHTFGAFSLEPVHRIQHCTTSHGRPTEAAPRRARLPEPPGPADGNASGRNDPTGRTPLKPIVFGRWRGHLHTWEKRSRSERGGAGVGGGWRDGGAAKGGVGEDLLDSSEQSSGCCHTRKDSRPISFETQIPCLLMCSRLWPCGYIRARGPYEPVFYCMLNLILSTLRILGPDLMSSQPSEPTSSHEFLTLQTRS